MTVEAAGEVALVGEAEHEGDFGQGQFCFSEKVLGLPDPRAFHISMAVMPVLRLNRRAKWNRLTLATEASSARVIGWPMRSSM